MVGSLEFDWVASEEKGIFRLIPRFIMKKDDKLRWEDKKGSIMSSALGMLSL